MKKSVLLLALLVLLFAGKQNKHTGKNEEKTYPIGQIKTEMGEILFWLYDETPRHKPEFNDKIRHVYGAVGAGRDDNPGMLSSACQFYIVQNKDGEHRLDDKYTVFGQVFKGMDIVDSIVSVKTDSMNSPLTPIKMDVNIINLSAKELKKYHWVLLSDSSEIFHK